MEQTHQVWRRQYRANRYMEHLCRDDLLQRGRDIFDNLLLFDEAARVSPLPLDESAAWWILWTHFLEELVLRPHEPGLAGFPNGLHFPDPRIPGVALATAAANRRGVLQQGSLVKVRPPKVSGGDARTRRRPGFSRECLP